MKRRIFLIVILFLMLFVVLSDRMYTNSPIDESSESITSFGETLVDDDVWFYPDSCLNTAYTESFADVSDWGVITGGGAK